jgi:hypothetical protein
MQEDAGAVNDLLPVATLLWGRSLVFEIRRIYGKTGRREGQQTELFEASRLLAFLSSLLPPKNAITSS